MSTPSLPDGIRLIIFDLDGTVLDTVADLADAVCYALQKNGFPPRTYAEVMSFVGNGVLKLIERALPDGHKDVETVERVHDDFTAYYGVHCADKTRPYDGMPELLLVLKRMGYKLAVLSNKPDKFTSKLIERFYPGVFDMILGSGGDIPRKPDPTGELRIIGYFGVSKSETLHIGDSETDVMTAKNAGVRILGCSWGYRSKETIVNAGAQTVVDSVGKMAEYFGVERQKICKNC